MRLLSFLFFISSFIISCSGWNSELDTVFVEDPQKSEKPVCQFKPMNNCYSRGLNLVMNCMSSAQGGVEKLSQDWVKCSNQNGKTVLFRGDSLKSYFHYEDQVLNFSAYNKQKKCFDFMGDQKSFSIQSDEFGELSVTHLDNGDISVQCFFDEGFVIPAQAQLKGCRGEKALGRDIIPTHQLKARQENTQQSEVIFDHFQFSLLGAGAPATPMFQCEL